MGCRWHCVCPSCTTLCVTELQLSFPLCVDADKSCVLLSALAALSWDGRLGPRSHPGVRAGCCAPATSAFQKWLCFYGVVLNKKGKNITWITNRMKLFRGVFCFLFFTFCLLVSVSVQSFPSFLSLLWSSTYILSFLKPLPCLGQMFKKSNIWMHWQVPGHHIRGLSSLVTPHKLKKGHFQQCREGLLLRDMWNREDRPWSPNFSLRSCSHHGLDRGGFKLIWFVSWLLLSFKQGFDF